MENACTSGRTSRSIALKLNSQTRTPVCLLSSLQQGNHIEHETVSTLVIRCHAVNARELLRFRLPGDL